MSLLKINVRKVLVLAVSTLCMSSLVLPAQADPDAVAEARAALDRIQQESSAIDQDIIGASVRADESRAKLAAVTEDLEKQEAKVDQMASDLGEIAVVQLQSGGFDITAQLLTSDSESSFLSGLATIQNEANRSNSSLQLLQVEQYEVDVLRAEADRTTATLAAELATKEQLAVEYEAKEAEAQSVFDRLSAEEQERLRQLEIERQRKQAEEDRLARVAAEQAAATRTERTTPSAAASTAPAAGSPAAASPANEEAAPAPAGNSSRAQTAVAAALSKVGSAYVFGTSGPGSFDCSGLMGYAYKQAGISLPRIASAQYGAGTRVSKADLQPGDLVFFYSPISHVGMYIGNGQIVHAANPRSGVNVTNMNYMPFSGATRVS